MGAWAGGRGGGHTVSIRPYGELSIKWVAQRYCAYSMSKCVCGMCVRARGGGGVV